MPWPRRFFLRWLSQSSPEDYGRFDLPVYAKWMDDSRRMSLLQPFTFHQKTANGACREWTAPARSITDGATIPQAFWSIIGGPFEGPYREAAVVHDYYCCEQNPKIYWLDVHRMFYAGMRAREVESWKATLMYFAVYWFGPRWPRSEQITPPPFTEGDAARAARYMERRPTLSLDAIQEIDPATLRRAVEEVPGEFFNAAHMVAKRLIVQAHRSGNCLDAGQETP